MSLPPMPSFEHLGNRPFSFYPPIVNLESNKWFFRRASGAEILVMNSRTKEEIWIPRRFLGEISQIEDPVVIVGLVKELEYRAGAVWPHQRRVIEMPVAVGERVRRAAPGDGLAPVIGIRTPSVTDSRMGKLVGVTILVGFVASVVAVNVLRQVSLKPRFTNSAGEPQYLSLTSDDDYEAVVRKLGRPTEDRWQSETAGPQFHSLWYPQRGCFVLLMGEAKSSARYIGAMDAGWKPIHWVALPAGGSTLPTLRGLKKF